LRLYLTDAEFRQRVLNSKAWSDYLKLPPIPPLNEAAVLAEIEQRNALRSANHLPLIDPKTESARLKEACESKSFRDRFYEMTLECIREIYGPLTPNDFNSHSAMVGFCASKRNVIRHLIRKHSRLS
jgi:hypothetical protein